MRTLVSSQHLQVDVSVELLLVTTGLGKVNLRLQFTSPSLLSLNNKNSIPSIQVLFFYLFFLGPQVVIALSGGEILYFEIDESHTLNEASWRVERWTKAWS